MENNEDIIAQAAIYSHQKLRDARRITHGNKPHIKVTKDGAWARCNGSERFDIDSLQARKSLSHPNTFGRAPPI